MKRMGLLLFAAGLVVAAQPAQAQVRFGPQIAWADNTDLGVGGRIDFPLGDLFGVGEGPFQNLFASTSATYFFWDCDEGFDEIDCNFFEANGNLAVPFSINDSDLAPFVGTGLHIARYSLDYDGAFGDFYDGPDGTEVGLNILGGLMFPLSSMLGVVEAKLELAGAEQFMISAGLLF